MKHINKTIILVLLALVSWNVNAQQVNTLYFLENAPMRHTLNPALIPVSNGYLNFTPIGYMSFQLGLPVSPSDLVYKTSDGKLVTAFYSAATQEQLFKKMRKTNATYMDMTMGLLNLGFRVKEKGYVHINLNLRAEMGLTFPKPSFLFGSKDNLSIYNMNLGRLGIHTDMYGELALGYAHQINDQWTVGGKLKLLVGLAYANVNTGKTTAIAMSRDELSVQVDGGIEASLPIKMPELPEKITVRDAIDGKLPNFDEFSNISLESLRIPAGYGAALDLGFTYKPIKQLQITAAVNDLGFIYWTKASKYALNGIANFTGLDTITYKDIRNENFGQDLKDKLLSSIGDLAIQGKGSTGLARMLTAKLNVGVDANFWDNRIGVGVLSTTRFYNNHVYEEVTIGGALRPCNWFNLAVSYSLVENGKYSNIGAGLSFMPYDGINLTLAMDYIPTHYTTITKDGTPLLQVKGHAIPLPTDLKSLNLALGFSIVWGTNNARKDKDKDGIKNKFDVCPNTPKNVKVDLLGCPLDTDGDGVPDYLDQCPGTPVAAYGLIDEKGCPLDTDGDGVPDYLDLCPNTPEAAFGLVDDHGCALDSDGDGVADYLDLCPGTPAGAAGHVDENGCELDTDGDGVADWKDECPDTPEAAFGQIGENGCPLDSDGDGVPDYLDQCPNTPAEAAGHVDENGCELDTDGDGVPDWKDECPSIVGPAYNKGCPELKKEIRNLLNKAMSGIEFETGKATIVKKSYPLLDQIAQTFCENTDFVIEVQGHTDNVGKENLNKELSQKRANAVMDYLVKKGVDATRMTANGYGSELPIADNKTQAGRAKNRRVEFKITYEEVITEVVLEHMDSTLYQQHLDSIQPIELSADSVATQQD